MIRLPSKPRTCFGVFSFFTYGCLTSTAFADDAGWTVFTHLEAKGYSESFSIESLVDGIDENDIFRAGGDSIFTQNEFALGVKKGPWALSLLARYDLDVDYTPDSALIVNASERGTPLENGPYDIAVDAKEIQSQGLRLGYEWAITNDITITPRISLVSARQMTDGTLAGRILLDNDDVTEGELFVDYFFTNDLIFGRDIETKTAFGFTTDLIVDWKINEDLDLSVGVYDAFSEIYWKDRTGTIADATTAISRIDGNGVLIVRPSLRGQNLSENYTQSYTRRGEAKATYSLTEKWQIRQSGYLLADNFLSTSEAGYNFSSDFYVGANYEWSLGGIGLNAQWKGLSLGFAVDDFNISEARYAALNIGISHQF